MKIVYLLLLAFVLFGSCTEKKAEEIGETPEELDENLTLEELAKRSVESQLSIPATENYTVQIHKAQFNADDIEDAVILVNREQFAHSEAVRKNRVKNEEAMAYTGNFNFLFFYDGASKRVTRPITISSSAFAPLKISIENIQSELHKDFTIDYRIMENCYRNFFTVINGNPKLVFQWPVFQMENSNEEKFYSFEFASGTYSLAKDIKVFKGILESSRPTDLRTDFEYSVRKSNELEYLFFYNPKEGKYFTKKGN